MNTKQGSPRRWYFQTDGFILEQGQDTESQSGRGWKGPLWVIQANPPAKAGSPTVGCRGPCPGGS